MAVNFGRPVPCGVLNLAYGGDFVMTLVAPQDWPDDIAISFLISGGTDGEVTWDATIAGPRAEFDVPADDVQEVIDAKASAFRLRYFRASNAPIVWYEGPINVD